MIRVAQYSSTPTLVTDYQAQNAHLQAFTNQLMTQQFILSEGTVQPTIKQGCYVSHGGSLYVADNDKTISGSPADGSVYIRVSGSTSLTVEFITDIAGYVWNPVYNAMTNGIYSLLPYMIVKAGATWTRFNFNPNNQVFGEMKATSLDTGQGTNQLYGMNQGVKTTDAVKFKYVDTLKVVTNVLQYSGSTSAQTAYTALNSLISVSNVKILVSGATGMTNDKKWYIFMYMEKKTSSIEIHCIRDNGSSSNAQEPYTIVLSSTSALQFTGFGLAF